MTKMKARISKAIRSQGMYKSSYTGQLWKVEENKQRKTDGQVYVIKHKHPGRNEHIQAYAYSMESAVRKILRHEEWVVRNKVF